MAERRDVDAELLRRFQDGEAFFHLDLAAIYGQFHRHALTTASFLQVS